MIRDLVRTKLDSGEWTVADALAGLQTVFTLVALDAELPLEVVLMGVAEGYREAQR